MSQDCREHIPPYTWLMIAKHVGNVSPAEPYQGHTSGLLCTSLSSFLNTWRKWCVTNIRLNSHLHLKAGCLGCWKEEGNLLNTAHVWLGRWQSHNATILATQWQAGISWFSLGGDWKSKRGGNGELCGDWPSLTWPIPSCQQDSKRRSDSCYIICGWQTVWQTYLSVVSGGICLD